MLILFFYYFKKRTKGVFLFLEKLFRYIVKWTNNKCPKSKIAINFFRKKHEKTILLER